ncbi:hypothetical protein NBH20_12265 [Rhizobium sp. S153]|uniref:Uncharacterized protein n=1 Tax=Ciceribacter sichuanensis TaxID=2949647 RepID=A0ABT0V7U8_9HYPH|nr:hypothetical protein [Ciceribacter sp. S153]MCM2401934.1 hypothetical protein [Ciceribacter sp. S153]
MAGSLLQNGYRQIIANRECQAQRHLTGALLDRNNSIFLRLDAPREQIRRKERQHAFF